MAEHRCEFVPSTSASAKEQAHALDFGNAYWGYVGRHRAG